MSPRAINEDKKKDLKPWDVRPWPSVGDGDIEKLYAAVGRALSMWERSEYGLSYLFSTFCGAGTPIQARPAQNAYNAIRTFEGRTEMLAAASKTFFYGYGDLGTCCKRFKTIFSVAKALGPRRNEIAHGVVDAYISEPKTLRPQIIEAWALYPGPVNFKGRTLEYQPNYCYTSVEIDHYVQEFSKLRDPSIELAMDIVTEVKKQSASLNKSLKRPSQRMDR